MIYSLNILIFLLAFVPLTFAWKKTSPLPKTWQQTCLRAGELDDATQLTAVVKWENWNREFCLLHINVAKTYQDARQACLSLCIGTGTLPSIDEVNVSILNDQLKKWGFLSSSAFWVGNQNVETRCTMFYDWKVWKMMEKCDTKVTYLCKVASNQIRIPTSKKSLCDRQSHVMRIPNNECVVKTESGKYCAYNDRSECAITDSQVTQYFDQVNTANGQQCGFWTKKAAGTQYEYFNLNNCYLTPGKKGPWCYNDKNNKQEYCFQTCPSRRNCFFSVIQCVLPNEI